MNIFRLNRSLVHNVLLIYSTWLPYLVVTAEREIKRFITHVLKKFQFASSPKAERMVTVLTESDFRFSDNLKYLESGLKQGSLCFQGFKVHQASFIFEKKRLWDFTRTARTFINKTMTTFLVNELGRPEFSRELQAHLRAAFNNPYNYWNYKLGTTDESLRMLIFVYNHGEQFVADVTFNTNTFISAPGQYVVAVTLVYHRFTYFQLQHVLNIKMGQLQLHR